ncbi:RNase adapter RapZ [Calderihabitans maritimus]|uniref:RNase adapter RapZ n=1 Tax=Calderihabitans maritimus TaxID=1246530 RepID=UPI000B501952
MQKLVIITGLSGAGKTQAVRCLEDLGFFCVDNLPPILIPKFAELFEQAEGKIDKVALVMDIRGGKFFDSLFEALNYLDEKNFKYEILFLEASDETLVRRFKETRRRHPLAPDQRILEGIIEERKRLQELRGRASKIIDTSDMTNRQLREQVAELFGEVKDYKLIITVMSFGFKYGVPLDADLVMDVRFLPNPHYVQELRSFTGHDRRVREFVMNSPVTAAFLDKFIDLLKFLLPYYAKEGKSHLVIAIGCTGGQHRSVAIANRIGQELKGEDFRVSVKHRDILRATGAGC